MKLLSRLFKKDGIIRNRKVTKARFLYLYVIVGSIGGLAYFIAALIFGLPKFLALTPLYLLIGFVVCRFFWNNWKLFWMYIRDVEQGKLLMFLNDNTHWTDEHKKKVVNWVYLRRKTIRKETHALLAKDVMDGKELSPADKKRYSYKSVYCPQQILLGFNYALLIHALIYSHENIQVLSSELRGILELTDEHILAFDILKEREKAGGDKFDEYMEIGAKASEKLNK